jgi:CheY-like chemotaxis protein
LGKSKRFQIFLVLLQKFIQIISQKNERAMKTVLVAEDNDSNYILMTYILKRNYLVVRAKNGQEAVTMVDNGGIDIVLMDIKMPIMDGLEATRKIKENHPEVPIVALTANAFDSDRQMAMEAGCDEFLPKPVSSDKCLEIMAELLKN